MRKLVAGLVAASCVLSVVAVSAANDAQFVGNAVGIKQLLDEVALDVAGAEGQFTARYRHTRIVVYANEQHGRLRIMTPVLAEADLTPQELRILLSANYGRALDAKYAIGDGVVWALFNRPLDGLDRGTFLDGADQVVNLKRNFGTSYRSTELTFGRLP